MNIQTKLTARNKEEIKKSKFGEGILMIFGETPKTNFTARYVAEDPLGNPVIVYSAQNVIHISKIIEWDDPLSPIRAYRITLQKGIDREYFVAKMFYEDFDKENKINPTFSQSLFGGLN